MPDFSQTRYANIYPTPLITHVWEDAPVVNPLLRERILAHESEHPGVGKSNEGGWHSPTGHLEFCGDAGARLVHFMQELADEATRRVLAEHNLESTQNRWTLSAWANVNRDGDFNKIHVHPSSTWSGTYYVDTGQPHGRKRGTPLHLFDPCQGRNMTFLQALPSSVYIYPKPGLTVLFPSYMPHMVFPHNSGTPRISIAFNLRREPYP